MALLKCKEVGKDQIFEREKLVEDIIDIIWNINNLNNWNKTYNNKNV